MAGVRRALIVATDAYADRKLTALRAPAEDARELADVLHDEAVGGFQVETVLNRPCHEVEIAIAEFFGAGRFGDTLLAHFSCHGVKSPSGELYFATTDTDLSDPFKLKVTGVSSALVRDAMEESRASLILCLVDCCYSGAFVKLAKAADTVDLTERLGGKGRAVITASTSLQLALDGKEEPSLFTHGVIEGLRSGDADRDLDGLVSLDELYNFVHDWVTERNPDQTPVKSFDVQGEVYVARRSTPITRPAPLDADLLADARGTTTYRRLGAVTGLAAVLAAEHPGRSLAARRELERMAEADDSLSVRGAARKALEGVAEAPAPAIPDYEPSAPTRGGPTVDSLPRTDHPRTDAGGEAGGDGTGGHGRPRRPRWWRRPRRRTALAAVGAVAVLLLGAVTWLALRPDGGGSSGGSSGGDTLPRLPDTAILVSDNDPRLGHGIFALDLESGEKRLVVDNPAADFPTISEDRNWMTYLVLDGPNAYDGVPHLARVDGTDDRPLLQGAKARKSCPRTNRPAFSPDGGSLAVVCDDQGEFVGLEVVGLDGRLLRALQPIEGIQGPPTWTGDLGIVVVREAHGDGTTTLWKIPPDGGAPKQVTDGLDGSDVTPDWSDHGLLFRRYRGDVSRVEYLTSTDAPGVNTITGSERATWPTWAPGDEPAVVWLEPAKGGGQTLWVRPLDGEQATKVGSGAFGPPAWGSR